MNLRSILQKNLNQKLNENQKQYFLIRKGFSLTNLSGQISGWTDIQLSSQGRDQARKILPQIYSQKNLFKEIYSSDLQRSIDFADITLGFNGISGQKLLKISKELRELNFGNDEGVVYDILKPEEKKNIDSWEYKAINGESWQQLQQRMKNFLKNLENQQKYLIFTHGGSICSLTYELNIKNMIQPGSMIILNSDNDKLTIENIWNYDENNI